MEIIVFESIAYYKLLEEIKESILKTQNNLQEPKEWLTPEEAKVLLGIKSRTKLQNLRREQTIVYSKPKGGRIILYSRKSIVEYLERNSTT